jgi:hypothetical protein
MFVTEETKVLFYLLGFLFDLVISFKMIGNSEANCNTEVFVKSVHKLGHKL